MRFSQFATFDQFIQLYAFIDLAWKDASFTWFNKHFSSRAIQQCLDRALVNAD